MDYPFASRHEGPGLKPQGGTNVKPGFLLLVLSYLLLRLLPHIRRTGHMHLISWIHHRGSETILFSIMFAENAVNYDTYHMVYEHR